jgi:hypothetical protein
MLPPLEWKVLSKFVLLLFFCMVCLVGVSASEEEDTSLYVWRPADVYIWVCVCLSNMSIGRAWTHTIAIHTHSPSLRIDSKSCKTWPSVRHRMPPGQWPVHPRPWPAWPRSQVRLPLPRWSVAWRGCWWVPPRPPKLPLLWHSSRPLVPVSGVGLPWRETPRNNNY